MILEQFQLTIGAQEGEGVLIAGTIDDVIERLDWQVHKTGSIPGQVENVRFLDNIAQIVGGRSSCQMMTEEDPLGHLANVTHKINTTGSSANHQHLLICNTNYP